MYYIKIYIFFIYFSFFICSDIFIFCSSINLIISINLFKINKLLILLIKYTFCLLYTYIVIVAFAFVCFISALLTNIFKLDNLLNLICTLLIFILFCSLILYKLK